MPMTIRIALPIAPATETHCGGCEHSRGRTCDIFGVRLMAEDWDPVRSEWKRSPACIKATLPAEPWTEQRPTEGVWWVALRPEIRHSGDTVHAVTVQHGRVYCEEELCGSVDGPGFDGAKWMRREQPADPFAGGE